ncbi:MAG: FxLYD domain-containing protein [Candidatus Sumerlaeia bacterium]
MIICMGLISTMPSAQDTDPQAGFEVELSTGKTIKTPRIVLEQDSLKLLVNGTEQSFPLSRVRYFKVDLSGAAQTLKALKSENERLESEVSELKKDLKETESKYARQFENVKSDVAAEGSLRQQYNKALEELKELKQEKEQLDEALKTRSESLDALKAQKEAIEKRLAAKPAEMQFQIDDLRWEASDELENTIHVQANITNQNAQNYETLVIEASAWDADGKSVGTVSHSFLTAIAAGQKRPLSIEISVDPSRVDSVRLTPAKAILPR